jgi:hypothetical protein
MPTVLQPPTSLTAPTIDDVLAQLERSGLIEATAALRAA